MYKSLSNWTRPNEELVENPNSNQGLLTLSSSTPSLRVLTSLSASVAIYKVFPWQPQSNFPMLLVFTWVRLSQKLAKVNTDAREHRKQCVNSGGPCWGMRPQLQPWIGKNLNKRSRGTWKVSQAIVSLQKGTSIPPLNAGVQFMCALPISGGEKMA